jgi:hypothetical protein
MTGDSGDRENPRASYRGRLAIQPGQPIQIEESVQVSDPKPLSPLCKAMALTLRAYMKAGRALVDGEFANVRDLAPPHLRVPCNVYVLCCPDGVLVRYDSAGDEEPKVRSADYEEELTKVVPAFSDFLFHVPDDPATYVPEHRGPSMSLQTIGDTGTTELVKLTPLICVTKSLPPEFPLPPISARPPGLASISKYIDLHLRGEIPPKEVPRGAIVPQSEQFIAHAVIPLPVGWEALEIYPRLKPEYWKPEFASSWARIDLLSVIAQRNAIQSALHQLDSRGATRQHYAKLLEEFEELLSGPEEPCHQFLKAQSRANLSHLRSVLVQTAIWRSRQRFCIPRIP